MAQWEWFFFSPSNTILIRAAHTVSWKDSAVYSTWNKKVSMYWLTYTGVYVYTTCVYHMTHAQSFMYFPACSLFKHFHKTLLKTGDRIFLLFKKMEWNSRVWKTDGHAPKFVTLLAKFGWNWIKENNTKMAIWCFFNIYFF